MKKRLTTAQLRYSSVVRLFLLLLCVCGSNNVWASEEYLPVQNGELVTTSGTVALELSTTAQTIQATTHVQVTYGKGGWTVNGSKVTGSALARNGSGEYSYNNYACPTSGAYIVLTPSASGTIEVRGIKEGGGNKYMAIQTSNTDFLEASATVTCGEAPCAWTSDDTHHGYKFPDTKSASASDKTFTASFSVEAGLTYYITFDKFSNWSFTGFTFTEAAKNTFVWDFTTLSSVDTKLLNVTTKDTWVLNDGGNWQPTGGATIAGPISQNSKELEYVYGLELYNGSTNDTNTLIYGNGGGFRLHYGSGSYLRIPNLKAGDKVTVLCNNYSANRGITIPANITNDATATGWGEYGSTGEYTCVGYVTADGNVDLATTSAMDVRRITVESANKAWPTLSFANGSTPSAEVPYSGESTTYTNALTSVPAGATATYSILLDANAGGASAASINTSTGELTLKAAGEVIVRATVTAGTNNSAYYCDYILTVTQAIQYASWTYSADEKEIDGENRPYQGTVTFTSSGKIDGGTVISDVPGITLTIGASGDDGWTVSNNSAGGNYTGGYYAENATPANRLSFTSGCFYKFTPTVNGFLTVEGKSFSNHTFLSVNNTNSNDVGYMTPSPYTFTFPLVAGNVYYLCAKDERVQLHSFTFRPAFLNPTETAEQTETFEAYSATTEYPILVHSADAGVRFSGDRSVVNLSNEGDVTLVGSGTAVIRGKVLSGENELTASYTLKANVLSVASMTPTDGSTITTLDNSSVYIRFSYDIDPTVDAEKVVVLKDATPLTNINVTKAKSTVDLHEKTLVLSNFGDMEAGSTYTIRLMSGCVSKEGDSNVTNPEFIGTFTVVSSEPPLEWIYPSSPSVVRIGTSIVLQTSAKIDESYPSGGVIGTLTYEGGENAEGYPMTMTAIKDDKNLVFKPTKPLEPNQLYTLTVAGNQVKLTDSNSKITKDKVFMFTTGTATGSAPVLTSSSPANGAVINLPASNDKIDLYFDQNLELEPYSTVNIYPINGSESLSRGSSEKLNDARVLVPQNMTIDSKDPTHLSFEVGSDLKYDLYYEMVIPANTVTAPGGMPNSASTVKFKVNRNSNSTEVTPATFYPHTWDFNKFGDENVATTTAYNIINNYGGTKTNSLTYDNSNFSYKTRNANNGFDQGNDVYFTNKNNVEEVMDEFEGIRISLNKPNCQRFELAKVTKEVQQGTETQKVVVTNADGTTKWQFRMNGNTHYMTLSKVPAGKLYMVVNSPYLGINSPNATFESVSGEGYTLENNNTLLNTNGTKKVVIDVTEAGDISFVVKNFTCEKIAVAADTKTFKTTFVKDNNTYATDRLSYDVRYDLLNAFTSHNVKAYYVSAISDNPGVNAADIIGTQVDPANAVKADQGILAVYQGGVAANTEVPIFKTDVNTAALEVTEDGAGSTLTNMLKVIGNDETAFPASAEGYYNYVLAAKGSKTTGVGFYRYTGSSFSPRAAYLPIPISYVNTGSGSGSTPSKGTRLLLLDADEQVATAILEVKGDGIASRNNDGYYYNLNGMRVDQPKAGIYIRNGKKVVVMK